MRPIFIFLCCITFCLVSFVKAYSQVIMPDSAASAKRGSVKQDTANLKHFSADSIRKPDSLHQGSIKNQNKPPADTIIPPDQRRSQKIKTKQ